MPILSKYKSPEEEIIALRGALAAYDQIAVKIQTWMEVVAVPSSLREGLRDAIVVSKAVK